MSTVSILLSAFVLSVVALFFFIWSLRSGLFDKSVASSEVIFATGEIGTVEDPSASAAAEGRLQNAMRPGPAVKSTAGNAELRRRAEADASSAQLVFFFLCCSFAWLLVASAAGLTASIKLHQPDWLTDVAWLTFGRLRTIHLNAVAYGWAPMAGLGIALFVIPRLLKTPLVGARYAFLGAAL